MKNKEIVLSGIRPTGNLHLGNYFGAVRNFVKMQETVFPRFGDGEGERLRRLNGASLVEFYNIRENSNLAWSESELPLA